MLTSCYLPCPDTLDSIATEWEETETRVGSNVRFYCNDGEHYEYDAEEDEYFDEFNWVASDINCWSDGMEGKLLAFHTAERIPDEPEDGFGEDEGLDVSVITLCNHAFKVARSRGKAQLPLPLTIDDLMRIGRLRDGAKIDHFDVISHTIFHEVCLPSSGLFVLLSTIPLWLAAKTMLPFHSLDTRRFR